MASALYTKAKEALLNGEIDLLDDDVKVILVDSTLYTRNLLTDEFLDDIAGGAIVATSGNLSGKTTTGGVFDATDVTFTEVTGDEFEYVIIYQDTGDAATSRLIACIDVATGLPCTPNTTDIYLRWDSGADKIFAL